MGSVLNRTPKTLTQKTMKLLAATFLGLAAAKTYERCELTYELTHKQGFAKSTISEWICLIANESGYRTNAKGGPNYDGSYDWGLFQINDYYWCTTSGNSRYNDCNISCSKLTDTNIDDDCVCAKKIWNRHGFEAWYGWVNHCKNKDTSSYVAGCSY